MRLKAMLATPLSVLAGFAVLAAPAAHASTTASAYTSRLATLVNEARAQHGVAALTVTSGTSAVAAGWSSHLAAVQALSHNPDLAAELESHGSKYWTTYGENVGQGTSSDADALFTAYMNSPEHRANILDPSYRYLGIATVFTGSYSWNTMDFVDQYSSGSTTTTRTTTTHVASSPRPVHHTTTTTVRHATTHHVTHVAVRHTVTRPAHAATPVASASAPATSEVTHADMFLAAGRGTTLPAASASGGVRATALLVAALLATLLGAAFVAVRRRGV